eukprot:SAG11_NODE_3799_length_2218_cov_1.017933_1_plen_73_part_00
MLRGVPRGWSVATVVERLISGHTNSVRQLMVDDEHIGGPYSALFNKVVRYQDAVPLGLYRCARCQLRDVSTF